VHHCDYPQPDPALHDEALSREMDAAMQIVSAALALRAAKQLRVRLPLSEMIVVPATNIQKAALDRFKDQIADELNIKKIDVKQDFGIPAFKPDMKFIGSHYGKDTAKIREILADKTPNVFAKKITTDAWHLACAHCNNSGTGADITSIRNEFVTQLTTLLGQLPEYQHLKIEPEAIIVHKDMPKDYAVSEDKGLLIAINTHITPELEREGFARDIVRHIQHIRGETLCNDLFPGHSESAKEITLSGRGIRLTVQKV
jgi:isoleucyl-tRNA synthetase